MSRVLAQGASLDGIENEITTRMTDEDAIEDERGKSSIVIRHSRG